MRSRVAETTRKAEIAAVATLSASERVALALALGRRDLETFRLAHDPPLTVADAARLLDRRRQSGRRPSRCALESIG